MSAEAPAVNLPPHRQLLISERRNWLTPERINQLASTNKSLRFFSTDRHFRARIDEPQATLGSECDFLIFDTWPVFNADAFCALLGSLRAGGKCVLLVTDTRITSPLLKRLLDFWSNEHSLQYCGPEILDAEPTPSERQYQQLMATQTVSDLRAKLSPFLTENQFPYFLISGDRGRGKSHGTGQIMAELLITMRLKVILTSPRPAQANILKDAFNNALLENRIARRQGNRVQLDNGSEFRYLAADKLLIKQFDADLLVIEEAASMPVYQLEKLARRYPKIIFITTLNGYEGNGRGFYLRYWSQHKATQGVELKLLTPIRWRSDDKLEQILNRAFLLRFDRLMTVNNSSGLPALNRDIRPQIIKVDTAHISEKMLQDAVALLCEAHYQTRPSDVERILGHRRQLWLALLNNRVVGVCLGLEEGELAHQQIQSMVERAAQIPGELAPQTMVFHLHRPDLARRKMLRISRIAVSAPYRGQEIGSQLIKHCKEWAIQHDAVLLTSFSATVDVIRFWRKSDFLPIYLGHKVSGAGGEISLMMAIVDDDPDLLQLHHSYSRFVSRKLQLLPRQLSNELAAELRTWGSRMYATTTNTLDSNQKQALYALCRNERHWLSCLEPVFILFQLTRHSPGLAELERTFMEELYKDSCSFNGLCVKFRISGKKAFQNRLVHTVTNLLTLI